MKPLFQPIQRLYSLPAFIHWQNILAFRLLLLSKYIKKIGYRSYSRLKLNLAQKNAQTIDEQIEKDDSIKTIQSK